MEQPGVGASRSWVGGMLVGGPTITSLDQFVSEKKIRKKNGVLHTFSTTLEEDSAKCVGFM